METGNWTKVTEFILLGVTENADMQIPLFGTFLLIYVFTVLGNSGIIILIRISPQLHTPMYLLLSNLSFIDLCYSTVITPNMLANFLLENKRISFIGCAVQMFMYVLFGSTEIIILGMMAYDRYVAICNPLHYAMVITKSVSISLAVGSYLGGLANSLVLTGCTFRLPFCGPNRILHFFCDIPPLLKLACADTTINEVVLFVVSGIMTYGSIIVILISYTMILITIIGIRSSEGRRKAFSTCSSHFVCVTIFFGTILFMYFRPSSSYSLDQDRIISLFYTVVISMLNPLIYTLRNKQAVVAVRKAFKKMSSTGLPVLAGNTSNR